MSAKPKAPDLTITRETLLRRADATDYLLTVEDLAALLCLSTREVWRREAEGRLPRALRLGRKTVRWRGSDIEVWLTSLQPALGDACQ